jgi:mannose-6-phosphate isomerase-like protein (cupin superfamily)
MSVKNHNAQIRIVQIKQKLLIIILIKKDVNIVPKGTWHRVVNTGNEKLKLFSIYAPPEHPKNRVQRYKPLKD